MTTEDGDDFQENLFGDDNTPTSVLLEKATDARVTEDEEMINKILTANDEKKINLDNFVLHDLKSFYERKPKVPRPKRDIKNRIDMWKVLNPGKTWSKFVLEEQEKNPKQDKAFLHSKSYKEADVAFEEQKVKWREEYDRWKVECPEDSRLVLIQTLMKRKETYDKYPKEDESGSDVEEGKKHVKSKKYSKKKEKKRKHSDKKEDEDVVEEVEEAEDKNLPVEIPRKRVKTDDETVTLKDSVYYLYEVQDDIANIISQKIKSLLQKK